MLTVFGHIPPQGIATIHLHACNSPVGVFIRLEHPCDAVIASYGNMHHGMCPAG